MFDFVVGTKSLLAIIRMTSHQARWRQRHRGWRTLMSLKERGTLGCLVHQHQLPRRHEHDVMRLSNDFFDRSLVNIFYHIDAVENAKGEHDGDNRTCRRRRSNLGKGRYYHSRKSSLWDVRVPVDDEQTLWILHGWYKNECQTSSSLRLERWLKWATWKDKRPLQTTASKGVDTIVDLTAASSFQGISSGIFPAIDLLDQLKWSTHWNLPWSVLRSLILWAKFWKLGRRLVLKTK